MKETRVLADMANVDAQKPERNRIRRAIRVALPFLAILVFLAALFFMYRSLRDIRYHQVLSAMKSYAPGVLLLAVLATCANYLVLTLYDVLAFKYLEKSLEYRHIAFTSFISYVFSYNVGLSIFGSGAIRMRLYSSRGVDAGSIAKIVGFCAITFWLGLAAIGGVSLLAFPPPMLARWRVLGLVPVVLVFAYVVASLRHGAELRIRKFSLPLPSFRVAFAQVLVSSADWILASLVLYVLLPEGKPQFTFFVAMYVLAQFAGASSHVPGGLGIFESVIFASLSPVIEPGALAGALLVYRGIYYLAPLATAIAAFLVREAWVVRKKLAGGALEAHKKVAPLIPFMLSALVLFSGAVLLFSGATPGLHSRLAQLDVFLPLQVLELSHFSASLIGLALVVIADAVRRKIDVAYWMTLVLLASGAVASLLKALDYEEALVMLVSLALVLPFRRVFTRRAALLSISSNSWTFAVAVVVVFSSLWLVTFANKHALYSGEVWWVFELSKTAPRSLRAGVGVVVGLAVVGLRILLSSAPRIPRETLAEAQGDVRAILRNSNRSFCNLVLLGDKFLQFGANRSSFLMYGRAGRTVTILGDPVGNPEEFPDLVWDFYERVRGQGGYMAWHEVSGGTLPLLAELGFRFFKIGEEAIVDLDAFSLEGGAAKRLRPPRNKMIREGYSFRVLPPDELSGKMPELKAISDEWLTIKKGNEKGFSLGYFDERYLANFHCALVEKDGKAVAFSNLMRSGDGLDLSIDLMRHVKDVSNGTMEFLFIECMLWGKAQGCRTFSLGMAPMSGVEARQSAPLWNKAIATLFKKGEGLYNFQGLRAFKEKFNPGWTPRYIAISAGSPLPVVAADMAMLISRGNLPTDKAG